MVVGSIPTRRTIYNGSILDTGLVANRLLVRDHLGHTMVRATEIYAKVDVVSLRQVGDVDLARLVAHERDCAARAMPFFNVGDLNALREVADVPLGGVR